MLKETSSNRSNLFSIFTFALNRSIADRSSAQRAIEPAEQKTHPWFIFSLFLCFMLCVSFATYGPTILRYRVSFWQGITIAAVSAGLIFALVALFALAGNRMGLSLPALCSHAFGQRGAKAASVFLAIANIILAAYFVTQALYQATEASLASGLSIAFEFPLWLFLLICAFMCLVAGLFAFFGGHFIMKISVPIAIFFIVLTVISIIFAARYFNIEFALDAKPGTPLAMISAILVLFASIAFVVIPVAPNFGRLIRTRKGGGNLQVSAKQNEDDSADSVDSIPQSSKDTHATCTIKPACFVRLVFFGGTLGLVATLALTIYLASSFTEFMHLFANQPLLASLTWSPVEIRGPLWIAILLVYLFIVSIFLYSASLSIGFLFPRIKKKWFALIASILLLAYCIPTIVLIKDAYFHIFALFAVFMILMSAFVGILFAKVLSFALGCAKATHSKAKRALRESIAEDKWNVYALVVFGISAILGFGFSASVHVFESPIAAWLGFLAEPLGLFSSVWYSSSYGLILAFVVAFLLIFLEPFIKFGLNRFNIVRKSSAKVGK